MLTREPKYKTLPDFEKKCSVTLDHIKNISEERVLEKFRSLKTGKSQGMDKTQPRFLKERSISLVEPLTMLLKKSFSDGQLAKDWRSTSLTPSYKKGSRISPGNYRPVSLMVSVIGEDMLFDLESHKLMLRNRTTLLRVNPA